jgi:hypothetical protein
VLNCHCSRDPVWTWPATVLGIVLTGLSHALSAQPCCPAALLPWSCRVSCVLHLVDSRPPLERAAYFIMCLASQTGNPQRIAPSSTVNSPAWGLACFYSSTVPYCTGLYLISNFQSLLIPRSIHSADYARSDNACCLPQSPKPGLQIVVSERVERQ